MSSEPDLPSRFAVEPIPAELDAAVQKALAKRPEARFQSAAEFERELERVAELLQARAAEPLPELDGERARGSAEGSGAGSGAFAAPSVSLASKGLLAVFLLVSLLTTALVAGVVTALMRSQ